MDFFSTYKLYKQGTSQVVAWLGKTAAQFGYGLGLADTSNHEKKVKKTGSKSNGATSTRSQVLKYKVAELPVLARVISEHLLQKSTSKTFPGILIVLKDVIVKRKQWAKSFGLPDATTSASNAQHQHFVTVLEDVYQILGGAMTPSPQENGQSSEVPLSDGKSTSMDEIALSNMFAVLDIEETSFEEEITDQGEAGHKSARRSVPPRPPSATTYELEDEIDEEEVFFMIYCFFADFQEVRTHLRRSWSDYTSGTLDLIAVAVTTNVALEMLQRAETGLLQTLFSLPKFSNLTSYQRVASFLMKAVAATRGMDPERFFEPVDGYIIHTDLIDFANFTCWQVYTILLNFRLLQGEHLRVLKPGMLGEIDLTGQPLSLRDKLRQHGIVLYELLPELCILNDMRISIPYLDLLSDGLTEMIRMKAIPIWLVFACQIYVDIHDTMLSNIGMAHRELQTMGHHFSTTLQKYIEFSKTMSFETWPEFSKQWMEATQVQADEMFRNFKLEADLWVNRDALATSRQMGLRKLNLPESPVRPYSLLSRHPLLCGLLLFRLNLNLQECGIFVVNSCGTSVPNIVHLYNAVKSESVGDDFPLWQDLEAIIRIQGKERFFMGDVPKNAAEYFKRFCLAMGYSASMFARNRRKGRNSSQSEAAFSKRGARLMVTTSTTADIFTAQYCSNSSRSEVTFHKIEKLLSTSSPLGKIFGTHGKQRPRLFTSVSFLSSLRAHIQSDILPLNLDLFGLHFRCTSLLRDLAVKFEPRLREYIGPPNLERESELPFRVGQLFGMAAESEMAFKSFKGVGGAKSALLVEAGELVKELVLKEGEVELERVRSVCRGYAHLESTTRIEICRPPYNYAEEMFRAKNGGELPRHRANELEGA
ncbi:unnamed protein product [Calypogeia fissa]